jgi:hypothetical protein
MVRVFGWMLLYCLPVLVYGQSKDSTGKIHLARVGMFYEEPNLAYYGWFADEAIGFLAPSYIGFWGRLYLNLQIPYVGLSGIRRGNYTVSITDEVTVGYILTNAKARFRPYLGLTYLGKAEIQGGDSLTGRRYQPAHYAVNSRGSLRQFLMPTVGIYYRALPRVWVDVAFTAPSGHSFLAWTIEKQQGNPQYQSVRGLDKTYSGALRYIQLGLSYQF